jgi:two-component system, NarL family, sensor kinase
MRKYCILLVCNLFIAAFATAQQRKLDSLHSLLLQKLPDTSRLKTLAALSEMYRMSKVDSAIFYGQKILTYPEHKDFHIYKAHAYNSIGYANYFKSKFNDAIEAFKKYYEYSNRINDKRNMAFAINNEGNVHIELGDYATALNKYKQALQLRQEINDVSGIAMSYNNIGFIYKDLGDYEKAVSNFLFALQEFEKLGNRPALAITYGYLCAVSIRQKNFDNALNYQSKAYEIQKALNDKNGMAISLQYFANISAEQKQYEKALEYYFKAKDLYTEAKDLRQLGLVNASIAELYSRQQMHDKAVPFYTESIDIHQKTANNRSLASIYLSAASSLIETKNLATARKMIDSAIVLTQKTNNKEHQKSIYEVETKYHEASGEYKQALQFASKYNAQKDILLSEANIKALTDMQVKYETEKKEQQIVLLNKDNAIKALEIQNQQLLIQKNLFELTQNRLALSEADLQIANNKLQIQNQNETILRQQLDASEKAKNIQALQKQSEIQKLEILNRQLQLNRRNVLVGFLGAVLLLIVLLGFSYYRRYRLKQEAKMQAAIMKQQELATRSVIEAEEAERQRIAKDLHDGVGQMMSAAKMNLSAYESKLAFTDPESKLAFEKILSLVDESCKEVRAVSHNMMPNALLKNNLASAIREFINKLDHDALKVHLYTEGLDQRLDSNIETVLYRVIQECVNNVIKHSGANMLDLSVIRDGDGISTTIEDNGKGFDTSDKNKFEGIGLKNIQSRVEYLKGTVDFNSQPGKGTLVAIHVPV